MSTPTSDLSASAPSPSSTPLGELGPPSAERTLSGSGSTPARSAGSLDTATHVSGVDVISRTDSSSSELDLSLSIVAVADRGTSSLRDTIKSLWNWATGKNSNAPAVRSTPEAPTGSTRHSLVRSTSSESLEGSTSLESTEELGSSVVIEGATPELTEVAPGVTSEVATPLLETGAAPEAALEVAAPLLETGAAPEAALEVAAPPVETGDLPEAAPPVGSGADPGAAPPVGSGADPGAATSGASAAPTTATPAAGAASTATPPGAGAAPTATPPGAGAAPTATPPGAAGTAPAAPTLTVNPATTIADIQSHATALNAYGTMPGSVLSQIKGHLEMMPGGTGSGGTSNVTISSRMARDATSGKYDLDTWDNRGTRCYKMDVTFLVSSPSGEVAVTKTIYTNAVDPQQALRIIDAVKSGVVDSARGNNATLQGESTFLLDFDKDKKTGQLTELKSIKGQTTNIDLTLPTKGAQSYTVKGRRIKASERHAGRVTYQSKTEMLQKGASYTIQGTGGRDVVMSRIATNSLTVDAFVKDIEKKEKELEETKKKSFMRFNGIFGNRESSDVGTFKAYLEAFDAVSRAAGPPKVAVVLTQEWSAIRKVKAYVNAHNAVVTAEQGQLTANRNVQRLQRETTELNGQLTAARQAVTNYQTTYDAASLADEEAQRALSNARTELDRTPASLTIGIEPPERTAARLVVQRNTELYRTAHSNLGRIDTEFNRLQRDVVRLEQQANTRNAELRRAQDALPRFDAQVTSAQRKFDRIEAKLSGMISEELAEFRREYDELAELKRTVDGMVTNPVTSATNTLSPGDQRKLRETQARLEAIQTNNRELLERLGLRGTAPAAPTPTPELAMAFLAPPPPSAP